MGKIETAMAKMAQEVSLPSSIQVQLSEPVRAQNTSDIDTIMSKYRSICTSLDQDLKKAADKIKKQQTEELWR